MEKDFNYSEVPKFFLHCINANCPLSDKCLRYQITKHVTDDRHTLQILNPAFAASRSECSDFLTCNKERYALGLNHLFDNLPHSKALIIKKRLVEFFKPNMYYRLLNKERLITTKNQESIKQIFLQEGIEEDPVFDEYIEMHAWFLDCAPVLEIT